jgi:hypothetical protein
VTYYGVQSYGALPVGGYDVGMPGGLTIMAAPALVAPHPGWGPRSGVPAEALRQQSAALLQHCYRWLEAAVAIVPQIAELAPGVLTAVQQYEAQQYEDCLAQVAAAIQTARQLCLAVPTLPPL